jgi:light-regulated signal transduction histidine kinase (bacteriophytochrome)
MLQVSHQENFQITIAESFPVIKGDRVLIEQIFTNLITNGLKYNDKPQKEIEIGYLEKNNHPEKNYYVFYVKDNGIGIREKYFDVIFRIFKRLHTQQKYGGGTGAGLTIVKKIVEHHGGKIWIESIYGESTTFYFTLTHQE